MIEFLRHETFLTAGLLSDLSAVLTEELVTLAAATSSCAGAISRMLEAVQREDLIQQRLVDMSAALGVLERAIGGADAGGDLGAKVAAQLRLGETRARLVSRLEAQTGARADPTPAPRAGEIDLF